MTRRQKCFSILAMAGMFTIPIHAEPGMNPAGQQLQGTWLMKLTLPGQPPAPQLVTYNSDGSSLSSAPGGPTQHGVWVRIGDRSFATTIYGYRYDDKGVFAGMIKIRAALQLSDTLDRLDGTAEADVLDPDGNVLISFGGITFTQKRIGVETKQQQ